MKKVLVSLLVLAVAMSSVFAAVNVNGEIVAGYTFNKPNNGDWQNVVFGQDNFNSAAFKLNANISDDEGIWSGNLKGIMQADSRLDGKFSVDFGKVFMGADSDVSIVLDVAANNRIAGLNAYNNASGLNLTRIRTNNDNLWFGLTVGYTDLVKVQVAGGPNTIASENTTTGEGDFLVSALVNPINGLGISAGYVLNGEGKTFYTGGEGGKGAVNAAVNANIGTLAGLDFDLGVSAAYKYAIGNNINNIYAVVYGGVDVVNVAVEYGVGIPEAGDLTHALYAGVDLNVLEGLILNVYGGATNLSVEDTFYVGGNVGYTVSGITLNANIQYTGDNTAVGCFGDIGEGAVKTTGFSITPSIAVAF